MQLALMLIPLWQEGLSGLTDRVDLYLNDFSPAMINWINGLS